MLSLERSTEAPSDLITYGAWHVHELTMDQEKIEWIWREMQKYPTLFSDLTRDNEKVFLSAITNKFSYWLEVDNDDGELIGLMYVMDLYKGIDATVHLIFFDRRPTEKAPLVREMIKHVFLQFPYLHRLTAVIPSIYHATIRLARKTGFAEEGRKRQSLLIRHEWCDEVIFGILGDEV